MSTRLLIDKREQPQLMHTTARARKRATTIALISLALGTTSSSQADARTLRSFSTPSSSLPAVVPRLSQRYCG
jgi:hypothetical protein